MADTAITLASTSKSPLSIDEAAAESFTNKFTIKYSDIAYGTGSTDTVTVTLGTTPATWYVDNAAVNITTAFAGTTALTLVVGSTTTTNAFIASTTVKTAALLRPPEALYASTNATATAAKSLVAVFTNADGGSPSAVTAGQLDIYIRMIDTSRLP